MGAYGRQSSFNTSELRGAASGAAGVQVAAFFTANVAGLDQGLRKVQGSFGNTQKTILGFLGAISFTALISQMTKVTSEAVKFERVAVGFEALARRFDLSSQRIIQDIRGITQGQVATVHVMESVNKALTLLPPSAERMTELATIATGAAAALGLDVRRAFDDITTGIGRASPKILDNLGIVVNAREAYAAYADKIGTTTNALGAEAKQIALLNQVIDRNIERFGIIAEAVQPDIFQQFTATLTDLRIEFGKTFISTAKQALSILGEFIRSTVGIKEAARYLNSLIRLIVSFGVALAALRLGASFAVIVDNIRNAAAATIAFRSTIAQLHAAMAALRTGEAISPIFGEKANRLVRQLNAVRAGIRTHNQALMSARVLYAQSAASAAAYSNSLHALAGKLNFYKTVSAATLQPRVVREMAEASRMEAAALSQTLAVRVRQLPVLLNTGQLQRTINALKKAEVAISTELRWALEIEEIQRRKMAAAQATQRLTTLKQIGAFIALAAAIQLAIAANQAFADSIFKLEQAAGSIKNTLQDLGKALATYHKTEDIAATRARFMEIADEFYNANVATIEAADELTEKYTAFLDLLSRGDVEAAASAFSEFQRAVILAGDAISPWQNFLKQIAYGLAFLWDLFMEAWAGIGERIVNFFLDPISTILNDIISRVNYFIQLLQEAGVRIQKLPYVDFFNRLVSFGREGVLGWGQYQHMLSQHQRALGDIISTHGRYVEEIEAGTSAFEETVDELKKIREEISELITDYRLFADVMNESMLRGWMSLEDYWEGLVSRFSRDREELLEQQISLGRQYQGFMARLAAAQEEFPDFELREDEIDALEELREGYLAIGEEIDDLTQKIDIYNAALTDLQETHEEEERILERLQERWEDYNTAFSNLTRVVDSYEQALSNIHLQLLAGLIDPAQEAEEKFRALETAIRNLISFLTGADIADFPVLAQDALPVLNEWANELRDINEQTESLNDDLALHAEQYETALDSVRDYYASLRAMQGEKVGLNIAELEELISQAWFRYNRIAEAIESGFVPDEEARALMEEIYDDILQFNADLELARLKAEREVREAWKEGIREQADAVQGMLQAQREGYKQLMADIAEAELRAIEAAQNIAMAFMESLQSAIQQVATSIISGDIGSALSSAIQYFGEYMNQAVREAGTLSDKQAKDLGVAPGVTAAAAAAGGWWAVGAAVVASVVSSLFGGKGTRAIELAQPVEVEVINPITLKTPPTTRALLASGGTIFSSDFIDFIKRGGLVVP